MTLLMGGFVRRWASRLFRAKNSDAKAIANQRVPQGSGWPGGSLFRKIQPLTALNTRHREEVQAQPRSHDLNEARFRSIFEHAAIGVVLCRTNGFLLECNPAFQAFLGYSNEELCQMHFIDITHPEDVAKDVSLFQELIAGDRSSYQIEKRYFHKNGTLVWVRLCVSMVRDAEEDGEFAIATVEDITDAKLAEENLQQSEEKFRQVADNIDQFFFVRDARSGQFLYVSPAYERMFGRTCESLYQAPMSWLEAVHPDDRDQVYGSLQQQIQGRPIQREYRIIRPDGTIRWISAQVVSVHDQNHQPVRYVGWAEDMTERKQLELALHASEARLNDILNSAIASINSLRLFDDGSWHYDYCSAGCEHIFGYSPQELMTNPILWRDRIVPEDYEAVIRPSFSVVFDEGSTILEYRYRHKDGTIRWIATNLTSRRDPVANCWIVTTVDTDISDRKRVEDALRESQNKYQTLFQILPIGISITDADGNLIEVNPASEKILGLSVQTHTDLTYDAPVWHIIRPDGTPMPSDEYASVRALRENRFIHDVEMGVMRPQGGISWINVSAAPIPLDQYGVAIAYVDITARKQAEAALKQQAERERLITEITQRIRRSLNLEDILATTVTEVRQFLQTDRVVIYRFNSDSSGEFLAESVAPGWRSLLQMQQQNPTLTARAIDDERCALKALEPGWDAPIHDPESPSKANRPHQGYFSVNDVYQAGLRPCYIELVETFQARAYIIVPIFNNSQLWGLLATYQNSGPRDWQDDEVKCLVQIVPHLGVALQHAELLDRTLKQSAELKHAKEAADAANRAKSLFLAHMSHELRTPLNAILGFTQLMATAPQTTLTQRENLTIINQSGEHLLALIDDVLDMSKIEAGKVTLNTVRFDLHNLLNTLEGIFQPRTHEKNLTLRIHRDRLPQYVEADEGKLRQILTNLLSNAIKFTENGGITLSVSQRTISPGSERFKDSNSPSADLVNYRHALEPDSTPETTAQCFLTFAIEDTGAGILPEELKTLFEPFVQTETGRKSQQGTGLGLSISRGFVQLMGGTISVESVVGRGTTFQFDVPVRAIQAIAPPQAPQSQRIVGIAPGQPNYQILVVDDARTNRLLLLKILQPLGFEVLEASHGQDAVMLWEQYHPHLILMDMQMPVMDGYEATRQIRARVNQQRTPDVWPLSPAQPGANEGEGARSLDLEYRSAGFPKILALTANAFDEAREQVFKAGCDDFLCKPLQRGVLLDKLAIHLGVTYLYAHESAAHPHPPRSSSPPLDHPAQALTPDALRVMPNDWIDQLLQASTAFDKNQLLGLVSTIPDDAIALRHALLQRVNALQFDVIMKAAQQALE